MDDKQRIAVWFNEEHYQQYMALQMGQPFNDFVKNAFHEKVEAVRIANATAKIITEKKGSGT